MKYNIKKAGEYSNKLQNKIDAILRELGFIGFGATPSDFYNYDIVENHKKSALSKDYEDEVVNVIPEKAMISASSLDLLKVVDAMLIEKLKIDNEISKMKKSLTIYHTRLDKEVSLDIALQDNKKFRETLLPRLKELSEKANINTTKEAEVNSINVEGNATKLKYIVEVEKKLKFDAKEAAKYYKELLQDLDELSYAIDNKLASELFEFEPQFDVYDNIEKIVEDYMSRK